MKPLDMADALSGWRQFDLSRPYRIGMPQSANHPRYWHTLPRRHGDMVRADGGSAANDYITMGTHVGTHIDAPAHVSQDGKLFGGVDGCCSSCRVDRRLSEPGRRAVDRRQLSARRL